jgi:hypothetical protein
VTDDHVHYFTGIYQDGTHLAMWRCLRCQTEGGTTNASLSQVHFRAHWKTQACTRALHALREPEPFLGRNSWSG